ncbi:MAG TPA: PHP-associated domain-containing protein [Vicinamibacterales bacterium]|nr:PHP-associated domain-containing protein [Vicinamibacterales bacterium]
MLKVDLHTHTSDDPQDIIPCTGPELVDRAVALGFHALAVTLHDRQLDDPALDEYAARRGLLLVPGIERTIERKHVLLLNFPAARAERVASWAEVARLKADCPAGLVVAPHPFYPGGSPLGRVLRERPELFDAVECSYFTLPGIDFNARAVRWAREHGKPIVACSDLHDLRQLGRVYTLVDADPTADAICEAVRRGRVRPHPGPAPPLEVLAVFSGMTYRQVLRRLRRHKDFPSGAAGER